jgi:hypothetical protein
MSKVYAKREFFYTMAATAVFHARPSENTAEDERKCGHCGLPWSQCLGNCQTP